MNAHKILTLTEKCIEKAANDFLEDKPVAYQSLQTIMDSVRILHHAQNMAQQKEAASTANTSGAKVELGAGVTINL